MKKDMKFVVQLQRPHCRKPIPPIQHHKIDVRYSRKLKHKVKNDVSGLV